MNKFTKSMAAIAVSGVIAGPAAAVEFDATWVGTKGEIKLSGDNCKGDSDKNLAVDIEMYGDGFIVDPAIAAFDAGPNTGIWDAFVEGVELGDFDGEGTFVISQRGKDVTEAPKKATLGLSDGSFFNIADEIGDYAALACKKYVSFDSDTCQQSKGDAKWSKDGEQLSVKVDVECKYLDDKTKLKDTKAKIKSGNLDLVAID